MYRTRVAIAAALSLTALSACGQTDGEPTQNGPTGDNRPVSSSTTAEAPPTAKFGESFTFRNGLAVAVAPPTPYTPSANAYIDNPTGQYLLFTFTVVNGSPDNYDPALFTVNMQSGNRDASKIYDSANNIGSTPSTVVLPGREAEFDLAFAVSDPQDLVMEVSPGFEYRDAIFTY